MPSATESRLVDLATVCLICLREEPGYCSIFGQDLETPQMQIVDKIRNCSAWKLEANQLNQLPDKICHGCRNELSITYRFQQKCLEAAKVFQTVMSATAGLAEELEEQLKMDLEQQQVKVPASLKIKRVEAKVEESMKMEAAEPEPELDPEPEEVAEEEEQLVLSLDEVPLKETNWETESLPPATAEPLSAEEDYLIADKNMKTQRRRLTQCPPKICDICGNTYKYQHALNAHMRRHNNERPFPCEVCQKAFISNVELRRHMRVHTGQKPYGCLYCDRRFSDFGSSKKHERIHTGERPYVCEVCHKGFAYAHVLSVHRRTHTGNKQFQCSECDKGFTKKTYLAAHLEQHLLKQRSAVELAKPSLPTQTKTEPPSTSQDQLLGEQTKVLEECIVTHDFMFSEEHTVEEADLDDEDFRHVRAVKGPYELVVGDLLDEDEFGSQSKYLMD